MSQEMLEESYCSDEENDNEYSSYDNQQSDMMKHNKKNNNRSFILHDNGNLERIIRKRKRKSTD